MLFIWRAFFVPYYFLPVSSLEDFVAGVDSDSGDGGDLLTSTISLTASWMCFIIGYTIRIDSFS